MVLGFVEVLQVSLLYFLRSSRSSVTTAWLGNKRTGKGLERLDYLFFKTESPVAGIICSQEVIGTEWLPQASMQAWCLCMLGCNLSTLLPLTVYSSTPCGGTLFCLWSLEQFLKLWNKHFSKITLFPCRPLSLDTPFPLPFSQPFLILFSETHGCVYSFLLDLLQDIFLEVRWQNWHIPAQAAPVPAKGRVLFPIFTRWRCFYFPEWCLTVLWQDGIAQILIYSRSSMQNCFQVPIWYQCNGLSTNPSALLLHLYSHSLHTIFSDILFHLPR